MEAREIDSVRGLGLFATKDYKTGDVLVSEMPLVRLAPSSEQEEETLVHLLMAGERETKAPPAIAKAAAGSNGSKSETTKKLRDLLEVPQKEVSKELVGKYKGMVQSALCYIQQSSVSEEVESELSKLSCPDFSDPSKLGVEKEIVQLAQAAFDFLDAKLSKKSWFREKYTPEELMRVMLVWSTNSFEGGRIYSQISRANHSCNPNAVVVVARETTEESQKAEAGERQSLVAAADISVGTEVCISYLGSYLYASTDMRRQQLQQTKHFVCQCDRCTSVAVSGADWIPCPQCNPRLVGGRQLDEDAQYDDDGTVSYVSWNNSKNMEPIAINCKACKTSFQTDDKNHTKMVKAMQQVRTKVGQFLESRESRSSEEDEETEAVESDLLDQHLRLASSVMGARHWTTNLLLLLQLDDKLQSLHGTLMEASSGKAAAEDEEVMTSLAEAIDMLQRVGRFVDGLGLSLHRGHLLSHATLGVARALVALGDDKSLRYAADWLNSSMLQHMETFEAPFVVKVAQALAQAWKKRQIEDDTGSERKPKASRKK